MFGGFFSRTHGLFGWPGCYDISCGLNRFGLPFQLLHLGAGRKWSKLAHLCNAVLSIELGMAAPFRLWTDPWHPRGLLLTSFPRGPAITGLPADSFLRAVLHQGQWRWPADTHFDIQEIMAELPSIGPQQTDVIRWKPGNFSSQSVFSFLQPASPPVLWHQLLGGKFKIPRHDFILWLAVLERLSTMDRLWASRSDAGCMLCGGQILETHEHLFFECSFSKRCLDLLKHRVRFQWLRCGWHRDVIWASGRWRGKHLLNQAFRAVLASIVYYIWRERNNRRFSATASSAEAVVSRAVEEVRCRIISANCKPSLQLFVLYRIWKIPWARP
ncbi:UNVERIFIED_CONTAM: hypothetical protein Sradi_7041100 [Sesamum radiatum]|uniref:Reverse transcriptase zinc-binding domain-containing protein n=1 Tax=Sesamum radiatum TaxID=300843 RepID=A0AAW2J8J6_SESRA